LNALELTTVTKRFGGFVAVNSLSFHVPKGSIIGFLGPNGAGKSTSLRMALGILTPDEGHVRLFGETPSLDALHRVGFLPEERGLYKKMTARATISYFARLKGMGHSASLKRADELLEATGLGIFRRSPISKLSKGMAQKVQILSTLAHEPDFLILDEPFSGLDPVNQTALEALIREQHQRGATILFSTHVMEHAERLCEGIVMLARGRKVFDGTLEQARGVRGRAARVSVTQGFDLAAVLTPRGFAVETVAGTPGTFRVILPAGVDAQHALAAAVEAGAPVSGFVPEETRLRDVFLSLVGEAEAADLDRPASPSREKTHA
jgi:ABC-2 type transport system ATP-binding protein